LHFGFHDALLDASAAVGRGMPLSFETKTMTVGELFSGSNVFRMPIFQRPYSWDEETALELFGRYPPSDGTVPPTRTRRLFPGTDYYCEKRIAIGSIGCR
jgi:hypothetical protein